MRRIPVMVRAILILTAVLTAGAAALARVTSCDRTVSQHTVFSHVRGALMLAVSDALPALFAEPAQAEDALQFKPIPPESAHDLERATSTRRHKITINADDPDAPEPPEAPDAPETDLVIGKSGNVMRIGSDIRVEKDQVVAGDLMAVRGDVTVLGHVHGDVVAMGGDVHLAEAARVDGDVVCIGGQLSEEPGAQVGGQRVTASSMRGVRRMERETRERTHRAVAHATQVTSAFVWLMIALAIAWIMTHFAPARTEAAANTLRHEPAISLGIGALVWALLIPSLIALCLVVALLCITIIGIPLGLAALVGYALFLALLWVWGYVVAMIPIGAWFLARRRARSAPLGVMSAPPPPTLTRQAVVGVLLVTGTGAAGEVLQTLFFAPPLQGLGSFVSVVSIVAAGLAATIGGGAWLRSEFATGLFGRWWRGRRTPSSTATPATPAPTGAESVVATSPASEVASPTIVEPGPSAPPPPSPTVPPPGGPSPYAPPGFEPPPSPGDETR